VAACIALELLLQLLIDNAHLRIRLNTRYAVIYDMTIKNAQVFRVQQQQRLQQPATSMSAAAARGAAADRPKTGKKGLFGKRK